MKKNKIIIVGAGIAGIAASIRLSARGHDVTVYEANAYPGGKLTCFSDQGYRFDMGPSLFTMPQLIEQLFEVANKPIENYFKYKKKEVVCNYFYEDGTTFSAVADENRFALNAEKTFNVDAKTITDYFKRSKNKYDLTASLFLEKSLHKTQTYLNKETLKALFNINSLDISKTLSDYNTSVFKDERLVQFYNRFATYNGSSPYQTPGIMSMIPHLEQHYGTYFPKGGMHQITMSLFQLAKDIGVDFQLNTKVNKILIEQNRVIGVAIDKQNIEADIVVSNADIVPTYKYLLKELKAPEKILSQPRSSSALIFYWGITEEFPQLDLHNIFFSEDYETEFDYIFDKKDVYHDPTVYINISSKEEPIDAPKGHENWFTMINVPSNVGQNWDDIIENERESIIKKLSRILPVDISKKIAFESILDPRAIEYNTQSYQGALYGASSNNKYAAFLRHPNFKSNISNLYFCGGSVHPGGGIPLCLLSGKIVSDLIEEKRK